VRCPPADLSVGALIDFLDAWSVRAENVTFLPEGDGAHHWIVHDRKGRRWVATVDDLGVKPWLGSDGDTTFAGLLAAYRTAALLRHHAGLSFVVAPEPTATGEVAVRLGPQYALSLCAYVDGVPGRWGEAWPDATLCSVGALLAEIHSVTAPGDVAAPPPFVLHDRHVLEAALADVHRPWGTGPFSEDVRRALERHRARVTDWLDTMDRSVPGVERSRPVLTHGEPHPGNFIRPGEGLALVDWDTVALGHPERDLWMLDNGSGSAWATYEALSGRTVDRAVVRLYRLAWVLNDLASYLKLVRGPHDGGADARHAATTVQQLLTEDEPSPYGPTNS